MTATWRVAVSLLGLRREVNAQWPNRSDAADGFIGDAAHIAQGSASDHNPWIIDAHGIGVVRAFDITADGIDAPALAEHLRQLGAAGDRRLADHGYVIFNGQITSAFSAWTWTIYHGDPHTSHIHVSVARDPAYDDESSWGVAQLSEPAPPAPTRKAPPMKLPASEWTDDGHLHCLVIGLDQAVWSKEWDGTEWLPWVSLGGVWLPETVDVNNRGDRLDIIGVGTNHELFHLSRPSIRVNPDHSVSGGHWTGLEDLNGIVPTPQ
jgi:hypothetical protein